VDIRFRNARLLKLCNDSKALQRQFGRDTARVLRQRLDDLDAAGSLAEFALLPGNCEELKGGRRGQLSLRLTGGLRLVFTPDHVPVPAKKDGGLDWGEVSAVVIEEVVDYHG
jgi:toxin HigB-1